MRQFRASGIAASIAGLAACASVAADAAAPPAALRGCWIERRGADTLTMRWFPKQGESGWRGDLLTYAPGEAPTALRFDLDPTGGERERFGWAACQIEEPHGPPCRRMVFGDGASLGEGDDWMEIHASADHLRFVYRAGPAPEDSLVLFDGQRDGCD